MVCANHCHSFQARCTQPLPPQSLDTLIEGSFTQSGTPLERGGTRLEPGGGTMRWASFLTCFLPGCLGYKSLCRAETGQEKKLGYWCHDDKEGLLLAFRVAVSHENCNNKIG